MSEIQAEVGTKKIFNPEVRKDYQRLKPVIKATEETIGGDNKTRRISRRAAFLTGREKQKEVDEATQRAEESDERAIKAEKEIGKDPLTGVANKEKFKEELKNAVKTHIRLNRPFSVLMLDLDNFKEVNEVYGHLVGDTAIKEIALLLESEVRGIDVVGRFGGDEFAVILTGTPEEYAVRVAEKLRDSIKLQLLGRLSHNMPGRNEPFTSSIGLASFHPNGVGKTEESVDEVTDKVITEADIALFNSKRDTQGNELKDRVTTYKPGMTIPNLAQVHTEIES